MNLNVQAVMIQQIIEICNQENVNVRLDFLIKILILTVKPVIFLAKLAVVLQIIIVLLVMEIQTIEITIQLLENVNVWTDFTILVLKHVSLVIILVFNVLGVDRTNAQIVKKPLTIEFYKEVIHVYVKLDFLMSVLILSVQAVMFRAKPVMEQIRIIV